MSSRTLNFYAQFTASKAGKTGLSDVTPLVYRVTRANPPASSSVSVSGVTVTEVGGGIYCFGLGSLDLRTYDYVATLATADSTVDQKTVPALWSEYSQSAAVGLADVAAGASGGVPAVDGSGRVTALVSVGTGAGQVNASGGKVPATLAAADTSGNLPADLQTIKGQTVTAATGVTFPASLGTSTLAAGAAMTLTSGERTAIATAVELQIMDETDGRQVLNAIVAKINSVDADLSGLSISAIAAAVWAQAGRTITGFDPSLLNATTGFLNVDVAGIGGDGAAWASLVTLDTNTQSLLTDTYNYLTGSVATTAALANAQTTITAIKAKSDNLPADPASNTQVNTRLAFASYTAPDTTSGPALLAMTQGTGTTRAFKASALANAPTGGGGGGGVAGPGADECTLTITDDHGTPIANASVWISDDAGGSNVVAGTKTTNSQGDVLFLLDAGLPYYLWMRKDGFKSIDGELFTAVAD